MVLAAITALKKLCNHPKLIYDMINAEKNTGSAAAGFESCGASPRSRRRPRLARARTRRT
eukprot:2971498-Pyramimonas_sp.AAC.1